MHGLKEETRLEIAVAMRSGATTTAICERYGIDSGSVKHIWLLYSQYGKPGLRDSSMTLYSKPSIIPAFAQELIVTIILNYMHLETIELQKLLEAEMVRLETNQIQRFLTQAGLGNEDQRKQYLEEIRGITDSTSLLGIQRFAFNKFGAVNAPERIGQLSGIDRNHYLAIAVKPKLKLSSSRSARLYAVCNLYCGFVEIIIDDLDLDPKKRKLYSLKLRELRNSLPFADAIEYFLWNENLPGDSQTQIRRIFLDVSSDHIEGLNDSFIRLNGDRRLTFGGANEHLNMKIDFKFEFLKALEETIKIAVVNNTQNGNVDQIAFDFAFHQIQNMVTNYNSGVIDGIHTNTSAQCPEDPLNAAAPTKPVVKYSELIDGWLNRVEEH